jgi:hypothetical protein
MSHPIHRIESFEQTGTCALRVRFADGLVRTIDFAPVLEGELFGPLRDPVIFRQVKVDPEIHTLVWTNGADFDPAALHDWPEHEPAFRAAARQWAERSISINAHS